MTQILHSLTFVAAAALSAGCATTPKEGCDYKTATQDKVNKMNTTH